MHEYYVTKFTADFNVFHGDASTYYKPISNYKKTRDLFPNESYEDYVRSKRCLGYLVPQE
jgi:hypothetical protein